MAKKSNYKSSTPAPKSVRRDREQTLDYGTTHKHINTLSDVAQDSEDDFHQQRELVQLNAYETEVNADMLSDDEVFAIDNQVSEDSDFSDYDQEETDRMDRLSKQLLPKAGYSDDESHDEEDEEIEDSANAWGKSKRAYYNAEETAIDDEDVAREEEQEAILLQKKLSAKISAADYLDDSFATLLSNRLTEHSTTIDPNDAEENTLEESIFDINSLNKKTLSVQEKNAILLSMMPEVPELIADYTERYADYKQLQTLNASEMTQVTTMKMRLLSAYLLNLTFYFMQRIDDRLNTMQSNPKTHPVVDTLVQLRDMLDAMAEIDLVESSDNESNLDSDLNSDDLMDSEMDILNESDIDHEVLDSDPERQYNSSEDVSDESGLDSEPTLHDIEPIQAKTLFQASQISLPKRDKMTEIKIKKRKSNDNDFGEQQEQEQVDLLDAIHKKRSLKFHVTKIDKNIASRAKKMNKFGGDDDLPIKQKRVEKDEYLDPADDFSDSPPQKQKKTKHEVEILTPQDSDNEYETLKQSKSLAKQAKKDLAQSVAQSQLNHNLGFIEPAPDAKRQASYQILSNKGLTPHRPKIDRNPRVKRRVKYETAMKKLKDFKRVAVDKSTLGAYHGEASGIKTKLARSVKL